MFAASLSLGLVLLPFVSGKVIDVDVGAGGALEYSPEAVVSSERFIKMTIAYPLF
jgi:hypothetical protein